MKKLLSLLLCMMLIVCAVPMAAFADTVTPTVTTNDLADSKIEIEKKLPLPLPVRKLNQTLL